MDAQVLVMSAIALWVIFLAYPSVGVLNDFYARKLCHAGCGLGMMLLDSKRLDCRLFVWAVAASSIAMTWNLSPLPPFRFARPKDVGITVYLMLVSVWFYAQLQPLILAPLFFADPAGAVVCACTAATRHCETDHRALTRYCPLVSPSLRALSQVGKFATRHLGQAYNPAWYQKKTVCGTLAVFIFTYATITYEASGWARRAIAACAAVVEALGGEFDNLAIAAVVLIGWQACGGGVA